MDSKDKLVTLEDLKVVHDEVARYATCSTAASTAAKTAALTNFVLTTGSAVKVKFTNTNTADNPTLNVNSTGAKPIIQYGTTVAGTTATESWDDGAVVEFVYDGTNWVMQGRNTIDAVSKSAGGTFDGNVQINRADGTTSVTGTSTIRVGNDTATGADGNSKGRVIIYGEGTKYANLQASNVTGNQTIEMPNTSGTLMTDQGGTFNGTINIDQADGTTSAQGWSELRLGNNKATGTAGNSAGNLQIYGRTAYKTEIIPSSSSPTANRVLYLPDASGTIALKEPINLNTTDDLNNLNQASQSGMYYIQSSAVNAPTVWASLEVIARPNGGCTQIVTSTNGMWIRQYTGSPLAWSIWKKYVSADQAYSYTPSITAPSVTGFSVDNITFLYKLTSEFLWLSGRFRVVNHGTGDNYINISYPTGVKTITGVGSFGTVHVTNSLNSSALSIRPSNDGTYCFIQSGAGNTSVSSIIPNGYYVIIQAMIPLR